jgi:hypothetical protein
MSLILTFFFTVPTAEIPTNSTFRNKLGSCRLLFQQQLDRKFLAHTFILALLYCINNQIAFFLFQYVDIVTISLFKSFTSFQSAIFLWCLFQRPINRVQWSSIVLQVMGLIIVQYDVCKKMPILAAKFYAILLGSCFITSICTVWNEYLLKNYSVNLHIQNAALYLFGTLINLTTFIIFYNQNENYSKGFFEGYSILAIAVVFSNSILGLVITVVYKYADAIIKTFSSACATGVLLFFNWQFFGLPTNLVTGLGAAIIFIASYIYFSATTSAIVSTVDSTLNKSEMTETIVFQQTEQNVKSRKEINQCPSFPSSSVRLLVISLITVLLIIIPFFPLRRKLFLGSYPIEHSNQSMSASKPMIISLDNYQLNRPIVIHGKHLCFNNSNNSTKVFIDSKNCSPIELCCDTVLSCHVQGLVSQQPTQKQLNITITRTDSSNQNSMTSTVNLNLTRKFISYWEKNNVALVIHFNRNLYERIDFLTIYRELFPTVIFTGPDPHPQVLHCPEGRAGLYAYSCLSRAITLYPNYTGYLMPHFDVLPIFHNLQKRDLNRIWIPLLELTEPSKATGWHWPASYGKRALEGLFSALNNISRNSSLHSKYLDNYMRNVGKNLTSSFSDIFYLPRRLVSDWFVLTDLMLKNQLFLEIGFAAATLFMTSTTISKEIIQLNGENWSGRDLIISLHNRDDLEYYHRIDHTSRLHQYFVESIVRRSMIT